MKIYTIALLISGTVTHSRKCSRSLFILFLLVCGVLLYYLRFCLYSPAKYKYTTGYYIDIYRTPLGNITLTLDLCSNVCPRVHPKENSSSLLEVITLSNRFIERICELNIALECLREREISEIRNNPWIYPNNSDKVFLEEDDSFMQRLQHRNLKILLLPWLGPRTEVMSSLTDDSDFYSAQSFGWAGSPELCKWIVTPGTTVMKYDVIYNKTCITDIDTALLSRSISNLFLNSKPINLEGYWPNNGTAFPDHFYTQSPPYVTYIHIVRQALLTPDGEAFTQNIKLVPNGCGASKSSAVPEQGKDSPLYDEVFVIAQGWGSALFHRMVEIIPRLILFLDFLRSNPQVMILAPDSGLRTREFVRILGLDHRRLVRGFVRARLAYIPRSTPCGFLNFQEGQMLSKYYQKYTEQYLKVVPRDKLIMVERRGSRIFTEKKSIEKTVAMLAFEHGLQYELFSDNPIPSLLDTMTLFHSAVLVVAPHGAGLSNILFSQPSTYIIEGVCDQPHVNLCFLRLSLALGHHWHGIPARRGCLEVIDVSADEIGLIMKSYLTRMENRTNLNET